MTDEVWARGIERELGASGARQDATDANIARIATEMRDGFTKQEGKLEAMRVAMHDDLAREASHIRGEVSALSAGLLEQRRLLKEEEDKREQAENARNIKLVEELRLSGRRSQRINQYVFAGLILAAAGLQQVLEHFPLILDFIGIGP